MRVIEFIIEEETGWSVEYFLKTRLQFGKKQISRLKFRDGGLLLNGCRCRTTAILQQGDRFCLRLDEEGKIRREREGYSRSTSAGGVSGTQEPVPAEGVSATRGSVPAEGILTCLYEDQDILAVYKPGGIPVHPSHGHHRDTLWNQIISRQEALGEKWTPRIIGRLDMDTSGIILVAKNTETAAAMMVQRENKLLRKVYVAEAEGIFDEKEGVVDSPLEKDSAFLNRMRTCQEGLSARTHYRVLEERGGRSILRLELEDGRTHQIRVHLSSIGHALLGDRIYGQATEEGETELHLHAGKLSFRNPFTNKEIDITAPLPKWLKGGKYL